MNMSSLKIVTGTLREVTKEEKERYKTNYKYVILSPYEYECDGKSIKVPPGFLSDGATWAPDIGDSWIFHDYLYATHKFEDGTECSRIEADNVMLNVLRNDRMRAYHYVVRLMSNYNLFYGFSRAWNKSGARGPEFLPTYEIH